MKPGVVESPFYQALRARIDELGGLFNAHLHLDRYGTLDPAYFEISGTRPLESSHISLHEKHQLIGAVHAGRAYDKDDLQRRVNEALDTMEAVNTVRADTMVDTTADRVGLTALQALGELKKEREGRLDLRLAAYSPLGFKDSEPQRWATFEEGAKIADFLGALPESDDRDEYPDNIGFEEHCVRFLDVGKRMGLMIHVHTDQRNDPSERGTERLIEMVRKHGGPEPVDGEPMIWAVHAISPATYDDKRHEAMIEGLLECGIGIICCPSAAIGMRQLRPLSTPTYNSIPRVLELLAAGVHVRLGSDNVADICSPSTTADLVDEVYVLSAAVRYYQIDILAKLAAGHALDDDDRGILKEHLAENDREIRKVLGASSQAAVQ